MFSSFIIYMNINRNRLRALRHLRDFQESLPLWALWASGKQTIQRRSDWTLTLPLHLDLLFVLIRPLRNAPQLPSRLILTAASIPWVLPHLLPYLWSSCMRLIIVLSWLTLHHPLRRCLISDMDLMEATKSWVLWLCSLPLINRIPLSMTYIFLLYSVV